MRKRVIRLLLALAVTGMVLLPLAGCGPKEEPTASNAPAGNAPPGAGPLRPTN